MAWQVVSSIPALISQTSEIPEEVGGWDGGVGTSAAGCFSLRRPPQTRRRRSSNLTS